jgi:AraC-like DNA-binding protein
MDERVKKAVNYISENINKPLELQDVAAEVYLSPYHFHKLFKKEFGIPLKLFIQNYKMERAFQLLNGEENIADISLRLGYKNYETFSRAFKRRFRLAPDVLKTLLAKSITDVDLQGEHVVKIVAVGKEGEVNPDDLLQRMAKQLSMDEALAESLMGTRVITIQNYKPDSPEQQNPVKAVKSTFTVKDDSQLWTDIVRKLNAEDLL